MCAYGWHALVVVVHFAIVMYVIQHIIQKSITARSAHKPRRKTLDMQRESERGMGLPPPPLPFWHTKYLSIYNNNNANMWWILCVYCVFIHSFIPLFILLCVRVQTHIQNIIWAGEFCSMRHNNKKCTGDRHRIWQTEIYFFVCLPFWC